jgi:hypothetical protein
MSGHAFAVMTVSLNLPVVRNEGQMFPEIVKLMNQFDEVALDFKSVSTFDFEAALRKVDECLRNESLNEDHRSYLKKRLEASLSLMLHLKSVREFVIQFADVLTTEY